MLKVSYSNSSKPEDVRELKDPEDFVVVGANSILPAAVNSLKCEARNGDVIYWEYKEQKEHSWNRTLPAPVKELSPRLVNEGELISLTIDDGDTRLLEHLALLNGFYRCNVKNTVMQYLVQAPPVRLIIACKCIVAVYGEVLCLSSFPFFLKQDDMIKFFLTGDHTYDAIKTQLYWVSANRAKR